MSAGTIVFTEYLGEQMLTSMNRIRGSQKFAHKHVHRLEQGLPNVVRKAFEEQNSATTSTYRHRNTIHC
jgi:hypothetical protein